MNAVNPSALGMTGALAIVHDERLGSLSRLAQRRFQVAVALIVRTDDAGGRLACGEATAIADAAFDLWFCANIGPESQPDLVVVSDLRAQGGLCGYLQDAALAGVRFYVECPLISEAGERLATLLLLDGNPQALDDAQLADLQDIARLAAAMIECDLVEEKRRRQERLRREDEERMALAIAGSGTGIWDRSAITGEIHYSAGWKAILGYSPHELSSRIADSYSRVHPDDLAYVQATIQDHFEGKTEVYEVEHRLRCKDGSYKWVSSRGKVVSRDTDGRALRMIGTTTDITPMRQISERLQQTVDLITNLTNEVPGLVFQYRMMADGHAFVPYASAGIREMYELEPDDLVDSAVALDARVHPEDLALFHASIKASARNLSPWQLEYRVVLPRQGLRWRLGHARPQRLDDGSTVWHGFITDATEQKRIESELQSLATTDYLTQLPNRRHFMSQAEAQLVRMKHDNTPAAAILMCDMDYFKAINDTWGHAVGDRALRHFAGMLRNHLRRSDMAGRIGGEEFAVLLHDASFDEALAFARRLQRHTAQSPLPYKENEVQLTVSIGIAIMSKDDVDASAALMRSDMALYRAKENGRNRIELQY